MLAVKVSEKRERGQEIGRGRGCTFILDFLRESRSWPDWLVHLVPRRVHGARRSTKFESMFHDEVFAERT